MEGMFACTFFELVDGGSNQVISAGNNQLFVGTTTMTTKTSKVVSLMVVLMAK